MKIIKNKHLVAFYFLGFLFLFAVSANKAFAGACISNGGSCWAVGDCNNYTSAGKDLIPVTAGDDACAQVYQDPVRCCKIGGTSSSKPGATSDGADTTTTTGGGCDSTNPTKFCNPLAFNTVEDFLTNIMGVIQKIIVTLSLVMIVIGAVQYVIAGVASTMDAAKKTIMAALTGLAIGIAAPSILQELSKILGWGKTNNTKVDTALSFSQILTNVLNFLLGTMGLLALVMMIIGAIMYLTSAGDDKRVGTGKNIFKYSLLGLLIAMSSMMIITQIAKFFVVQ